VIRRGTQTTSNFTKFQTPITQQQIAQIARRELSWNEKVAMITLFHLKYKISVICHIVNRPWSTVRNFIQRVTQRVHIETLPRSGRPNSWSHRNQRNILRTIKNG
jgi:hypothetical protein